MLKSILVVALTLMAFVSLAQIQVSSDHRFLQTKDGQPFFWLGDTAWELFHRLTREEAEEFLEIRKQQGFNVIQAVALAEFEGLTKPNRYHDVPLVNLDPTKLNTTPGDNPNVANEYDYWDHVDFIINKAAEKGMYIGLLPTWGDKVAHLWGDGPIVFTPENAEVYATALAKRYAKQWNIIWILGGDRPAVYKATKDGVDVNYDDRPVWRAMAKAIENIIGKDAFITYHPWGGNLSSSQYIHQEEWLDMNSFQSGHGSREAEAWKLVARDLELKPKKPALDMEPCYEDHPVNPWDGKWTRQRGYFTAYDVRARIYRGVFAGACGVTYGHHHVWQFMNTDINPPVNVGDTIIGWRQALHAQAATQMQYLKRLMLSRPYFNRMADQSLIQSAPGTTYTDLLYATRDAEGSYAMIYLPQNKPVAIDLSKITGTEKTVTWFDLRTGVSENKTSVTGKAVQKFTPPATGTDWVLIIDDASKKYSTP